MDHIIMNVFRIPVGEERTTISLINYSAELNDLAEKASVNVLEKVCNFILPKMGGFVDIINCATTIYGVIQQAYGRPVFLIIKDEDAYFFFGSKEEVEKKLKEGIK